MKILLVIIVVISTIIAWFNKTSVAWIFMISSFGALLLANLDKLKKFKLWGLEAELKDMISEANATIEQLKILAKAIAKPTIGLIAADMMPNIPFPLLFKHNMVSEINKALNILGLTKSGIVEASSIYYMLMLYLHGVMITKDIKTIEPDILMKLHLRINDDGNYQLATPKEYESFLKERDLLNEERKELIEDLQYFISHQEFRRPQIWSGFKFNDIKYN